jgi:hypothetical protein
MPGAGPSVARQTFALPFCRVERFLAFARTSSPNISYSVAILNDRRGAACPLIYRSWGCTGRHRAQKRRAIELAVKPKIDFVQDSS